MSKLEYDIEHLRQELISYVDRLVDFGLLPWFGGNNSVRVGDKVLITKTVTVKPARRLPDDPRPWIKQQVIADQSVLTGIYEDDDNTPLASSALAIHRAIYKKTEAQAIIHAHPYHATLLSFFRNALEPVDENGLIYLGPKIQVVAAPQRNGWNLVAEELADALIDAPVVILKWHGTFAIGATLADAMHVTRAVDDAARFIFDIPRYTDLLGQPEFPPEEVATTLGGAGTRILPPKEGST